MPEPQPGNVLKNIVETVRQTSNRVLATIDAFRPKILFKKPLTELRLLKGEAIISGEGLGSIIERIQSRIEEISSQLEHGQREPTYFEQYPEVGGQLLTKKYIKGGRGVHY